MASSNPAIRCLLLTASVCVSALATESAAQSLKTDDLVFAASAATPVFDPLTGTTKGFIGIPPFAATNIAFDAFGNVFADASRVDPADLSTTPLPFPFPDQIDAQGVLYTLVGGTLVAIEASGSPGSTAPTGLLRSVGDETTSFLPNGDLVVLDGASATVSRVDATTSMSSVITSGGLLNPENPLDPPALLVPLALDTASDGTIYVLSAAFGPFNTAFITRIDPQTGNQVRSSMSYGGSFLEPRIRVDGNGHLIGVAGSFIQQTTTVTRYVPTTDTQSNVTALGVLQWIGDRTIVAGSSAPALGTLSWWALAASLVLLSASGLAEARLSGSRRGV